MRSAVSVSIFVLLGAAACSDSNPLAAGDGYSAGPPYDSGVGDYDSGISGGDDSASPLVPPDGGLAEASFPGLPPIGTMPPGRPAAMCAGGAAPSAYLMAVNGTIFEFDPGSLAMRSLGTVACSSSATPLTLTVTTGGTAYVLYSDGNLYAVDLGTLACSSTAFQSGQLGLSSRIVIAIGAGNTADRLFAYGQSTTPVLGLSDLTSFHLFDVGAAAASPSAFTLDLASDAYGRLFTLGTDGVLYEIDSTTGALLGADHTGFDGVNGWTNGVDGTALMAYGQQLYFFSGDAGGVSRYDVATKTLYPMGAVNQLVVGASSTPCLAPGGSDADAGVPEGGVPEAGAPTNAFSQGDAWIGTFACSAGLQSVAVVVETVVGTTVRARFDFDGGSYELAGTYDPASREATFTPGSWVSPAGSSNPVGLDGYVDLGGDRYAGSVTAPGCGAFSLSR